MIYNNNEVAMATWTLVIQKLVPFQQKHGEHVKQEAKQENIFYPHKIWG